MEHPILGPVEYDRDSRGWVGALALPTLAEFGGPVVADYREDGSDEYRPHIDLFARGRVRLLVHGNRTAGPVAEQAEAVRRLVADEAGVCGRVLAELLGGYGDPGLTLADLREQVWCRLVEVSSKRMGGYPGGVAFIGFAFTTGTLAEGPACVAYHPERGAWLADGELADALEE